MQSRDAMDGRMRLVIRLSLSIGGLVPAAFAGAAGPANTESPAPRCEGAYADDFSALSIEARTFDRHPEAVFSHCTRNTAVYECLSYGVDGFKIHAADVTGSGTAVTL